MLEFHGYEYDLVDRSHIRPTQEIRTKTVQVEIEETVRRIIEVELPIDTRDTDAEEIVAKMYDRSEIVIDGDDVVSNVEVDLL